MCTNATKTAAALMTGIRPTLVGFMNLENVDAATQQEVLEAYDAADKAVGSWTPGTSSETVVELVNAVVAVFDTLPIPEEDKDLAGIISAGLTAVIAILEANSTTDTLEQNGIVAAAVVKVNTLAPNAFTYHKGIFAEFQASPAKQYHNAWNAKVEAKGEKYAPLHQG